MGVEAWRQGEVPHYVTSNPTMANSYAEIVLAFWRDVQRLWPKDITSAPLYICELGAGSGRFAFHFLKRLTRLCKQADVPLTSFCYVLTDFAERNLDFWRRHPRFQTYFESGLLDMAQFDVNQSTQLHLQRSGQTITPGSLDRPLVAITNYLFDCIPQDLFYIDKQRCAQCLVSLFSDKDPSTFDQAEVLAHVRYQYDYRAITEAPYTEPYLQRLMAGYQRSLSDTHLLLPADGLRCVQRVKGLVKTGTPLIVR